MKPHTNERGFVALMSVIIISAILLVLVFTLGISSFLNRFDVLDTENKHISVALAEACASTAMLKLAQNPSYGTTPPLPAAGECVSVGDPCPAPSGSKTSKTCKVCSVVNSGGQSTINVRAMYNHTYSNVEAVVTLSGNNFMINSWKELPTGGAGCTVP